MSGTQPIIHTRSEWTDEAVGDIPVDLPKTRIVLHHTADYISDADKRLEGQASWRAAVKQAHRSQFLHRHIHGWKDIGYHYIIDWEGRILQGRAVNLLGAHVERHNAGSIGVVLMGDLTKQRPTDKQLASLRVLLNWLMTRFDLSPRDISGHYQMKHTTCPGTYLNNAWDSNATQVDYFQVQPRRKRGR